MQCILYIFLMYEHNISYIFYDLRCVIKLARWLEWCWDIGRCSLALAWQHWGEAIKNHSQDGPYSLWNLDEVSKNASWLLCYWVNKCTGWSESLISKHLLSIKIQYSLIELIKLIYCKLFAPVCQLYWNSQSPRCLFHKCSECLLSNTTWHLVFNELCLSDFRNMFPRLENHFPDRTLCWIAQTWKDWMCASLNAVDISST